MLISVYRISSSHRKIHPRRWRQFVWRQRWNSLLLWINYPRVHHLHAWAKTSVACVIFIDTLKVEAQAAAWCINKHSRAINIGGVRIRSHIIILVRWESERDEKGGGEWRRFSCARCQCFAMRLFICALATFFICAMRPALWRDYESKREVSLLLPSLMATANLCVQCRARASGENGALNWEWRGGAHPTLCHPLLGNNSRAHLNDSIGRVHFSLALNFI